MEQRAWDIVGKDFLGVGFRGLLRSRLTSVSLCHGVSSLLRAVVPAAFILSSPKCITLAP